MAFWGEGRAEWPQNHSAHFLWRYHDGPDVYFKLMQLPNLVEIGFCLSQPQEIGEQVDGQ